MEKIEKAITTDDTDEGELFCEECKKEIKWIGLGVVDREIRKDGR